MKRYYVKLSRGGNWLVMFGDDVVQVCDSHREAIAVCDMFRKGARS